MASDALATVAAARALQAAGDSAGARALLTAALDGGAPTRDGSAATTADNAAEGVLLLHTAAELAAVAGDHAAAAVLLRRELALHTAAAAAAAGDSSSEVAWADGLVRCLVPLGHALWRLSDRASALRALARAARAAQDSLGAQHVETATCFLHLGRAYAAVGRTRAAKRTLQLAHSMIRRHHPDHKLGERIVVALKALKDTQDAQAAADAEDAKLGDASRTEAAAAEVRQHRDADRDERPPSPPLPQGWSRHVTAGGRVFYANHATRTTSWVDPRLRTGRDGLPPGWERAYDARGTPYYIDHNRKRTQRQPPVGGITSLAEEASDGSAALPTLARPQARLGVAAAAAATTTVHLGGDDAMRVAGASVGSGQLDAQGDVDDGDAARVALELDADLTADPADEDDAALPSWQGLRHDQRRGSVVSWDSVSSLASAVSSLTRSLSSASLASFQSARALLRAPEDDGSTPPPTPFSAAHLQRRGSLFGSVWDTLGSRGSDDEGSVLPV